MDGTPVSKELFDDSVATHQGQLHLAGESSSSSVAATIAFSDDRRLLVTSAGMLVADWSADDVLIDPSGTVTSLTCNGDGLMFAPSDEDAWKLQIAAHRLRSQLATSTLPVKHEFAAPATQVAQPGGFAPAVGAPSVPVVQVMQTTSVRTPRRTTHWLHLVLSVLTFGLWIPVWIGVAIFTGTVNANSGRTRMPVAPQSGPATQGSVPGDRDAVRESNRTFFKVVGIGIAAVVLLAVLSLAASVGAETGVDSSGATSTSLAGVAPTTQPASYLPSNTYDEPDTIDETETRNEAEEAASPAEPSDAYRSVVESRAIVAGTSGALGSMLRDVMDSASCEDLEFDVKWATDNYNLDHEAADRVLRAIDYAQEFSIGSESCVELNPYISRLKASA